VNIRVCDNITIVLVVPEGHITGHYILYKLAFYWKCNISCSNVI